MSLRYFSSDFRRSYGHPNIIAPLDPQFELGAEWLLGYFESRIREGGIFRDGETVQVGWGLVLLKADSRGDLEIWEPRFDAFPIEWIPGGTNTFRHLALQREACRQIGLEADFPSLAEIAVVSQNFAESSEFVMTREDKSDNNSGWLFAPITPTNLDAKLCSLFEVATIRSSVIPFLALPVGSVVNFTDSKIAISRGDESISSADNEFLRQVLQSRLFVPRGNPFAPVH